MIENSQTLLQELWAIATAQATDILQVQDGSIQIQDTAKLSDSQRRAIASIEKSTTGVKVKFYDKLKALELLGKYLGLFDSHPEDTTQTNLLQCLLAATREEVSILDLPEIQQAADDCHDMVESTES